jgi:hypothetical protein
VDARDKRGHDELQNKVFNPGGCALRQTFWDSHRAASGMTSGYVRAIVFEIYLEV